jgi:hypothetical protein
LTFHRTAAVLAAAVLTTLGLAGNAFAITKTFSVDIAPQVAGASKSIVYTATISNTLTPQKQRLGSVDLTVPEQWGVLRTSLGSVEGNVVKLRDLGLQPGESVEVALTLDTSRVAGTWDFAARGKQANDFKGEGNDFVLVGGDRSVLVEPTDAADVPCAEEPTANGEATPCRTSVTWRGVGPINEDGTPVPNDEGVPGLPASGASTRDGGATTASSTSVTQTSFNVTVSVVAIPSVVGNAGTLSLRLPAQNINCDGNSETSPVTALVNGPMNRAKNVSFKTDAGIALANPSQGMCFAGPVPFVPSPNAPVTRPILYGDSVFFQGTLPDCFPGTPTASLRGVSPCTDFRGNEGGDNLTSVLMPFTYPDPPYRG